MTDSVILQHRRENVYLVLIALFLGSMAILNVIGITRFINIGPLEVAIGVLPYPLTFLCTDLVSEIYGREKAKLVVWLGLVLNIFVIFILLLGQHLPAVEASSQPPWQSFSLSEPVTLANGQTVIGEVELFNFIYSCTMGAVVASMLAYLAAQFTDVYLFHFWKKLTKGKHLWLRNNMSTTISQLIDSFVVISITFGLAVLNGDMELTKFFSLMGSNYLFKLIAALFDTIPFYFLVSWLKKYLQLDSGKDLARGFD